MDGRPRVMIPVVVLILYQVSWVSSSCRGLVQIKGVFGSRPRVFDPVAVHFLCVPDFAGGIHFGLDVVWYKEEGCLIADHACSIQWQSVFDFPTRFLGGEAFQKSIARVTFSRPVIRAQTQRGGMFRSEAYIPTFTIRGPKLGKFRMFFKLFFGWQTSSSSLSTSNLSNCDQVLSTHHSPSWQITHARSSGSRPVRYQRSPPPLQLYGLGISLCTIKLSHSKPVMYHRNVGSEVLDQMRMRNVQRF